MEIYKNIHYFEEISSTNEYAAKLIAENKPPEHTVIVANNQIKGKGQRGNSWHSKKGENLTFSIIAYPSHIHASAQFIISECISLALAQVVSTYCKHVTIKWPNDIYVNNKKIAGILIEHMLIGQHIQSSIIGVGLNCNQTQFPDFLPNPTSLALCCNKQFSLQTILQKVLTEFEILYKKTLIKNTIHSDYIENLYMKNKLHTFQDNKGTFLGRIRDVNKQGLLIIEDNQKIQREYAFKQVAMHGEII